MTAKVGSGERHVQRQLPRVWQILALIFALYVLEQDGELLLAHTHFMPFAGTLGASFQPAPEFARGDVQVTAVVADGPMAAAGVRAGDHLHFDRTYDYLRPLWRGESSRFTLDEQGLRSERTARAVPDIGQMENRDTQAARIFLDLTSLLPALIGAYIVLLSRRRPTVLFLGVGILCYGLEFFVPQLWEAAPAIFGTLLSFEVLAITSFQAFALPAFALGFVEETLGGRHRWAWSLTWLYAALCALIALLYAYCALTVTTLPVIGDVARLMALASFPPFAFCFYYMIHGWRRSSRETQKRYGLLLMALAAVMVAQLTQIALYFLFRDSNYAANPFVVVAQVFSGIIAPILFAYAILHDRVFDLGFALNRTLVYGVVSTILLVAFGLIEWAAGRLLPIHNLETSALLDGGIALSLFLVFHRVRNFADHLIEDLFFRRWRDNEQALRRSVAEGAFIGKRSALLKALGQALVRFSGGAEMAIYLAQGGEFIRKEGHLKEMDTRLDADEPTLVTLRATHQPLELPSGTLALPMMQRARLTGVILVGLKPGGVGYRPDEREVLAWSAQQIAIDLHVLQVEDLNSEVGTLQGEVQVLRSLVTR
jgi:hypothetical protein